MVDQLRFPIAFQFRCLVCVFGAETASELLKECSTSYFCLNVFCMIPFSLTDLQVTQAKKTIPNTEHILKTVAVFAAEV